MIEQIDWTDIETQLTQKTSDWKRREESLQLIIDRLNQSDSSALEFVTRNTLGIALQLNDLRSALVKLASLVIEKAAVNASETKVGNFEKFTDSLLRDPNLVKVLGSANKVINIHAGNAFRSLFEFGHVNVSTLDTFYQTNKDSKNTSLRERIAEAFFVYLTNIEKRPENKPKHDGFSALRKSIDYFIKDASANVRTSAKKAKVLLDNLELDTPIDAMPVGSMEEEVLENKTTTRLRELYKKKTTSSISVDKTKKLVISKGELLKGMEIENDDTIPYKHHDGSSAKKEIKKVKSKQESVIDILENQKKQIKEKIDQLYKADLEGFYNTCDSDDFKKLLAHYQNAKNFELKKLIVKVVEGVKVQRFMGKILSYVESEKLDTKLNYSYLIVRLLHEDLLEFVEFFLFRNNSFSLKLLQRRFDVEEFDNILIDKPDMVNSLLTIISQNICQGSPDSFVKLNSSLLEHVYQSKQVVTQHRDYAFSEEFFEKLKEINPEMFEFLQNQKWKLGEKVVFRSIKNTEQAPTQQTKSFIAMNGENKVPQSKSEHKSTMPTPINKKISPMSVEEENDLRETPDSKLDNLLAKASLQTKKTVVRSILQNLRNPQTANEPYSFNKLFTKTLDVIKCGFDSGDLDEEMVVLGCELTEEMYKLCSKDQNKCMTIYDMLFDLVRVHPNFREKVLEFFINTSMRPKLYTHILIFIDSSNEAITIDSIKALSTMLKIGKESSQYLAFHKEVSALIYDVTKIMKELYVHPDVGVRKNVVLFIVQCFSFLESKVFAKILNEFSPDQQKFIDTYIKRVDN